MRFEKEGQAVMNMSLNLSYCEKVDFIRRIHIAKQMILNFKMDLDNKTTFLKKLKRKKHISHKF